MTPEQFTYWLQGYSEVSGELPTKEQWQIIKDRLQTVSHKVAPEDLVGDKPYIPVSHVITPQGGTGTPPWGTPTVIC